MDIVALIFWISFIFCLALTAGGILVIFRFPLLKAMVAFRHLQYYVILSYIFGYYSLWSELFIDFLPFPGQVKAASGVLAIMGTPFIVVASFQQVFWCKDLLKQRPPVWALPGLMTIVLVGTVALSYHGGMPLVSIFTTSYSNIGLTAMLLSILLVMNAERHYLSGSSRPILMLLLTGLSFFYVTQYWQPLVTDVLRPVRAFLFFLFSTTPAVYFAYSVRFEPESQLNLPSFESFIQKYGFTARESDIVREICNGKTNQQIADVLFVTLQTVKDHTSRIYLKADVKSRAQLMLLMRESL